MQTKFSIVYTLLILFYLGYLQLHLVYSSCVQSVTIDTY